MTDGQFAIIMQAVWAVGTLTVRGPIAWFICAGFTIFWSYVLWNL